MKTYDALRAPAPKQWLALDDTERVALVMAYHARQNIALPNAELHAIIHTVVENQLASGEPAAVRTTLQRLMQEGLDRHDAVHAIGMLVCQQIFSVLDTNEPYNEEQYLRDLESLSAASYHQACADAADEEDMFADTSDNARFYDEFEGLDDIDDDDDEGYR